MQGSGTQADPYILSSTSDLELLSGSGYASYVGNDKYFELGADIDFNGNSFNPIGSSSYAFNGHFDGKNHFISNMVISESAVNTGLFSKGSGACEIKNIVFRDCAANCSSTTTYYTGMLVGYMEYGNGASISNIETDGCYVTSSGYGGVGGIVGIGADSSRGSVTYDSCYVHDGKVTANGGSPGGIAGLAASNNSSYEITYSNCTVEREVIFSQKNGYPSGGIVSHGGYGSSNVTYSWCEVLSCVVIADGYNGGGIAGFGAQSCSVNYTNCGVDNTYIMSQNYSEVGGVIGSTYNTSSSYEVNISRCSVTNCTMYGRSSVGGMVGRAYGTVTITNPTISHNNIISNNGTYCGGAIGQNYDGGTVTGGTQDYNNIVGTGGVDVTGYTNQTSVADQYITADSLSAVVGSDGYTVTFTMAGQRGAGVSYNSTTNIIDGGTDWQYLNPTLQDEEVNFELTKVYYTNGTFAPIVHLYNPSNTTGVTLTSNSITITNAPEKKRLTNHDQSMLGRCY